MTQKLTHMPLSVSIRALPPQRTPGAGCLWFGMAKDLRGAVFEGDACGPDLTGGTMCVCVCVCGAVVEIGRAHV